MAFIMALSYSRRLFLRFFLDARMDGFLIGHALSFEAFGAVPRVVLYDYVPTAVMCVARHRKYEASPGLLCSSTPPGRSVWRLSLISVIIIESDKVNCES